MNSMIKTYMLMAGLTAFLMMIGSAIGGSSGMIMALLFSFVGNFIAYYNSDKMMHKMMNANLVERDYNPDLYQMVERLAQNAGLPTPAIYIMETEQPNAFATGRNPQNAAVAVTNGLMKALSRDELEAVVAHELAHIKNRDTLIMTITATIAGAISSIATMMMFMGRGNSENRNGAFTGIIVMILAPIGASLVQMCISRTREYSADAVGAEICGKPLALASALARIDSIARGVVNQNAERNPEAAHMFIINPLHAHAIDGLFSTHPKTQMRIERLKQIANLTDEQSTIEQAWNSNRKAKKRANPWGSR